MNMHDWLKKLVEIDTTSKNSNLVLIQKIADWLSSHHIVSHLTYDSTNKKANLFATLPAKDGQINGGLILSGHTDVVPVDGQQWDSDPFSTIIKNDAIYGRGTCDMKGFIAIVLALIPEFINMSLSQPLHFAFTYDEEVGCLGVPKLIADFQNRGIQPKACIVGEPTQGLPVVAHKGIHGYRCRVHGKAAHSSLTPHGCNSIEYAAQLICWIHDFANQLKEKGPLDAHFDVPFTSITTNVISGGIALNIIPALTEFLFEFRNLPKVDPESIIQQIKLYVEQTLLNKMQQAHPGTKIEIESIGDVPAFEASEDATITQLARALYNEKRILKVSYATEAGIFQQANIPTIVCGPGSIEQAHKPNEFVTIAEMTKYQDFLSRLVFHFAQS